VCDTRFCERPGAEQLGQMTRPWVRELVNWPTWRGWIALMQARIRAVKWCSVCCAASALSAMGGQCPGCRETVQNSKTAGVKSSYPSVVELEDLRGRAVGASVDLNQKTRNREISGPVVGT
jgi:hypothetical protein